MKQANKPASDQPAMHSRKLLGAARTTGALAAAATLLASRDESVAQAEPEANPGPKKGGGYRVTEHVLRYYQTTKV